MRLGLVVGTRPEIIKMSPVVRECLQRGVDFFLLHTGQHYSYNLDGLFFEELQLPAPDFSLNVGSGSFSQQLSRMMSGMEEALTREAPDYVLAEGDTNTVLAAALVASHLQIPFVHVEAGLRSYNRQMQEEKNRLIADRVADVLFPPTVVSRDILLGEGHDGDRIFVTGNSIVDAVVYYQPIAKQTSSIDTFGLRPQEYFLATIHRAENVDCEGVLRQIVAGLAQAAQEHDRPVIFPVHPRTRARIGSFGLAVPDRIRLIEPVGFYDFLLLESNAALVLTDSGGVQEECCILRVPCITLRDDTERPETLQVGSNVLSGRVPVDLMAHIGRMLARARNWSNPFGDGDAAHRMVEVLLQSNKGELLGVN